MRRYLHLHMKAAYTIPIVVDISLCKKSGVLVLKIQ